MLVTLEKGPNFAAVLGGGFHFYTATELEGWGWPTNAGSFNDKGSNARLLYDTRLGWLGQGWAASCYIYRAIGKG